MCLCHMVESSHRITKDCYAAWAQNPPSYPDFDVLVTNPPFRFPFILLVVFSRANAFIPKYVLSPIQWRPFRKNTEVLKQVLRHALVSLANVICTRFKTVHARTGSQLQGENRGFFLCPNTWRAKVFTFRCMCVPCYVCLIFVCVRVYVICYTVVVNCTYLQACVPGTTAHAIRV